MYGDGATFNRLIPAPLVTINKTYQRSSNGDIIGRLYTITVTGTMVAYMGSPMSDGTWHTSGGYPANESIAAEARLAAIQRKQEAIRKLFSNQGWKFEIQSGNGAQPVTFYPRIQSIDFPEDIWFERSNYTIVMEADDLDGLYDENGDGFDAIIESANEEWTIDTNEEPQDLGAPTSYTLTHSVSAVGKKHIDVTTGAQPLEAWEQAQKFVLSRLGFNQVMAMSSGVNDLPSYYNGWNHRRSNQVDKQGGGYSVTESWLMASGVALEDFTITTTNDVESAYDRVSIQGTVTGFEDRSTVGGEEMRLITTKWDNAQTKFTMASGIAYLRAQQYSGLTNLNVAPITLTVGRNPFRGTIDYTIDYDTRPLKLIEGAKSEVVSIGDNIGGELFASVFVLGRTNGPVLQDLNTKPSNTRTLTIELVVAPPSYTDRTITTMKQLMVDKKPSNDATFSTNLSNLVTAADPSSHGFTTVFQDQPQENWDFLTGRYTYQTTWTYE